MTGHRPPPGPPGRTPTRPAAPPPPRQETERQARGRPEPHRGLGSAPRPVLTHQNAHLLLAKEAGEEGGDGEAHGGGGTRDGQEQKGSGASPGLFLSRSRQAEREGRGAEEERTAPTARWLACRTKLREGIRGARTRSTTGEAAPAPALNLRLCHVTRQPRLLRQLPGPSNADRIASPSPHPPPLPVLSGPLRLRAKGCPAPGPLR